MLEWEEGDRYSFEDSERFEDESDCSWLSEPESLCNNWRGWKKPSAVGLITNTGTLSVPSLNVSRENASIKSLVELCARTVAARIPFEVVEQMMPVVPEQIQLRIAYFSFPDNEEDIRLYSCLANGNAEEFVRGENLYKHSSVEEVFQIGFHLSATVVMSTGSKGKFKVAVAFDRGRITTCNCTCNSNASWCSHVVAVCLHRIHLPQNVKLRAPVSESLSRLQRDQLQKFAQYLISELPQQILPTAQRLIDEILSSQSSDINTVSGAPDPTAGASASEQTAWWLDENNLHENIHKILVKFCVPSPVVFSDVNYLSSTAPPVAAEWQSLLRPLRGREPEGMWNLLSIVREMFKRHDHNAIPLLEVITEECLATEKILVWWVNTRVALHSGSSGHGGKNNVNSNSHGSQYACSSLCDEIVILWRLAALNPALSPNERDMLMRQFKDWHLKVLEKVAKSKEAGSSANGNRDGKRGSDIDVFPGFKPAIEACLLDWEDYPLPGITYSPAASRYYCPVMCCKHDPNHESLAAPISAPQARLPPHFVGIKRNVERRLPGMKATAQWVTMEEAGAVLGPSRSQRSSSVSSEGFCDNDLGRDSDSSHEHPSPDSGQVSRQNSREDARGCSMYQDFMQDRNLSLRSLSPRLEPDDQDQGCSLEDMDRDAPSIHRPPGVRNEHGMSMEGYRIYAYNHRLVHELLRPGPGPGLPSSNERVARPNGEARCDGTSSNDNSNGGEKATPDVFAGIKKLEDSLEILFARAEGLHAHGHVQKASRLAVQLAEELLAHPPNLMIEVAPPVAKSKRKKVNPASHQLTCLASSTLTKCAFLCTVLAEDPENTHLAFKVSLFGLEMPRPPASTKPLEVKLANQESDLVSLLKRLPLGHKELAVIRDKAELMRTGNHTTRGEALLPLMLAAFIFDALVVSAPTRNPNSYRHLVDESLGFEAAVAALAMKANVSEADHPLLCEGTRRQRGELGLTLLTHYKDEQDRLAIIMEKFLDKEVHQMYKAPSLPTYYATKNNASQDPKCSGANTSESPSEMIPQRTLSPAYSITPSSTTSSAVSNWAKGQAHQESSCENIDHGMAHLSLSPSQSVGGARPKNSNPLRYPETEEEARESVIEPSHLSLGMDSLVVEGSSWEDEYKEWEEKVSKHRKKRNQNFARDGNESYHSNLTPQGTAWIKREGPGSDSGSSGNSSDSIGSFSSVEKGPLEMNKPVESPPLGLHFVRPVQHSLPETLPSARPQPTFGKVVRYKGKRAYPTVPNQPSEASAYFMFELAKTVLSKAGGTSSTTLFKQPPPNTQNHRCPHRALQMCAFQIGLYALGLSNCVTPNWLSRTYSSHVSWISNQATEIGALALSFLIDTWEGHLTPQEAASIADKASRGRDANTIRQAARLALSCLPHAHALNPNEIQRAIIQCKELSSSMLEGACLAVEGAAKGGGVYPEVLFSVARCWYELYESRNRHQARHGTRRIGTRQLDIHQQQLQQQHPQPQEDQKGPQLKQQPQSGNLYPEVSKKLSLPPPSLPQMVTSNNSSLVASQQQAQPPTPISEGVSHLHPPVSLGVSVTTIHATNGLPTYPMGTHAPSVSYGIPGLPYPIGYNYIQSLPPSVSCINAQLPVQMFIQPPGVPFSGAQGGISPQALLPPPPLHSLQYYPPVSVSSTLTQVSLSRIQGSNSTSSNQQGIGPSQIQGVSNPPPIVPQSLSAGSSPTSLPQATGLIQTSHTAQQAYYSLPYSGPLAPNGFLNGAPTQPHPAAALLPFVRSQSAPIVQHQSQLPPTSQSQQQVRGALVGNQQQLVGNQQQLVNNSGMMHYLLSAYRVGMLAMETLARRVQDDRPQAKYARNPPYGEDVKWLLGVAKKLGTQYLHQFCLCSVNSIVSPFILYDLAVEGASYLSRNSPALYHQPLRSPILQPLVQKCQQMFIHCTQLKMYYISPTDYDEFISIVRAARLAFQMTPGGMVQFSDLLQALRRSKSCKKELWQRITSALQQPAAV